MAKIDMKIFVLLAITALLALGCPAPATPGAGSISGTVRDSVTGAPVMGATVAVGTQSALTDASGAFNLSYPSGGTITTNVLIYEGTDYQFWGTYNVQINVSSNPSYNFYLMPNNYSGYTPVTLTGNLPVTAGNNAHLNMTIENSAGGIGGFDVYPPSSATTYSLPIITYGADCIVSLYYTDDNLGSPIIEYYQHVDLSSSPTLDITTLPTTAVTLNGTTGDSYVGSLDYSPCDIPNYVPQNLLGTPSTVINICNPDNLPLVWATGSASGNSPVPGYQTNRFNYGPSTSFSTNMYLPSPASVVAAPTAVVDMSTVSWNAGTRTIAFAPAAGATLHVVQFSDSTRTYTGRILVNAPSGSVTLPSDFVSNVLNAFTWDVQFMPIASNRNLNSLIDLRIGGNGPINVTDFQLAMVGSLNGSDDVAQGLIN